MKLSAGEQARVKDQARRRRGTEKRRRRKKLCVEGGGLAGRHRRTNPSLAGNRPWREKICRGRNGKEGKFLGSWSGSGFDPKSDQIELKSVQTDQKSVS
ncbi:hypothetical protein LXL04_029255 [Taraxacum kok-saghyz]